MLAVEDVGLRHIGIATLFQHGLHAILNALHVDEAVFDLILKICSDAQSQKLNNIRIELLICRLKRFLDGICDLSDIERGHFAIPFHYFKHKPSPSIYPMRCLFTFPRSYLFFSVRWARPSVFS